MNDRKIHLIHWDTICQPKCNGGLGVRSIRGLNEAILLKLTWEIFRTKDLFWVKVLKNKYDTHGNNKEFSSLWKAIQSQKESINKAMIWAIGNRKKVKFWLNLWVGMGSNLLNLATLFVPIEERFKTVSEYVSEQGLWRWEDFAHWLPNALILKIASIKPPLLMDGEDYIY